MLRLPMIDYNGGWRTYQDVPVVVEKITTERHWKNLCLKKTQKFIFKVELPVVFRDGNGEIRFSEKIIVHDFAGDFSEAKIGDTLIAKIGYADENQQYWHGVNAFSVSVLKQEELIQLVN